MRKFVTSLVILSALLLASCDAGGGGTIPGKEQIIVITEAVSDITASTAMSGGSITAPSGVSITSRGVCWASAPDPTVDDNKTIDGTSTGDFVSRMTGLAPETLYFVRAYAIYGDKVDYGRAIWFKTPSSSGYDSGISSITGNIDMPEMTGDGMVECFEDYFAEDTYYWSMILYSVGRMGMPDDELLLEFSTPINDMNTIPDGRYPLARNIHEGIVNTADAGNRDDNGDDMGCWYYFHDGENYTKEAAAVGGKGFVEIELVEGSGEEAFYNISFEFYDTHGNKITGIMEEGYILNFSATEASSAQASATANPKAVLAKAKFDAKRNRM